MDVFYPPKEEIIRVDAFADRIEVVKRIKSNSVYLTEPPRSIPDKVFKEIYKVSNGEIVLASTVNGKHKPKHFVEESFEF